MSEPGWSMVLELAPDRSVTAGSKEALAAAIGRGADLRIYTEFLYEEHILPGGGDDRSLDGLIREVIDFRETILVDGRYVAAHHDPAPAARAAARLQRPRSEDVVLPVHDGRRPGPGQPRARRADAVGRRPASGRSSRRRPTCRRWASRSSSTSGPPDRRGTSSTTWRSTATSSATSGRRSWPTTPMAASRPARSPRSRRPRSPAARSRSGSATSAADLASDGAPSVAHEVFTLVGSGFVHVRAGLYVTLTHPLVRVAGAIPLRYGSGNWDVAWVFLRTDGEAQVRRLDPYTREWERPPGAPRLPLVRAVMRGTTTGRKSRPALKASCNLRPMLISHCPWSREGL